MRDKIRRKFAIFGVGLAWALLAAGVSNATSFNPELWEGTGGGTRNVYTCAECTFEQYLATPLPGANWSRNASEGNARLFLPDVGTNVPPIAPPGTPLSLDLVPEIEGDDYVLIAQLLSAVPLGWGLQGVMANALVARGTTMTFFAGRVIHTVASTGGIEYVLFSMSETHATTFDPFTVNGLAEISIPPGWSYSSEVLLTDLVIGTPTGIANVFSVPNYWTWQEIIPVPEPSADPLVGLVLLGIAARRKGG
ncbi:MAG: PEP-CTERM sorting domain-containing protein [Myxococcota bacterium]